MNEKHKRQSFLGANSEAEIAQCVVGIVGLGGGGSHIVQQLSHVGFKKYVIFDDDIVEESNLNRLIGAKRIDVQAATSKLHVAKMMVYGLEPGAEVKACPSRWQDHPEVLRSCHLVFGCVDTYGGRNELEICTRRYLINYIDIGMDVIQVGETPLVIGGQIISSIPGDLCMHCMGFLNEEVLSAEGRPLRRRRRQAASCLVKRCPCLRCRRIRCGTDHELDRRPSRQHLLGIRR